MFCPSRISARTFSRVPRTIPAIVSRSRHTGIAVVGVLAEPAHHDPPARPQLAHHERQIEKRVAGVVAREHDRPVRDPVDSEHLGLGDSPERRQNRHEPVHLAPVGRRPQR